MCLSDFCTNRLNYLLERWVGRNKKYGSGGGSVGRAVASDSIGNIFIEHLFTCLLSTVLKRQK